MKVTVSYYIPITKEIEMTPEEWLVYHATGEIKDKNIDKRAVCLEAKYVDKESAEKEMRDYYFRDK